MLRHDESSIFSRYIVYSRCNLSSKVIQAEILQGSAMGSSSVTKVLLLEDLLVGCG